MRRVLVVKKRRACVRKRMEPAVCKDTVFGKELEETWKEVRVVGG